MKKLCYHVTEFSEGHREALLPIFVSLVVGSDLGVSLVILGLVFSFFRRIVLLTIFGLKFFNSVSNGVR